METVVKSTPARIPDSKIRTGIFLIGSICGVAYIAFFLVMKALGLMHVTELRVFNYVILLGATFLMIRKWVVDSHHYVPFLRVVAATFFTGLWSFIVFGAFLLFYSMYDEELLRLFLQKTGGSFDTWPSIVVLFEGAGVSIITAFLLMQYFRKYEDGHPYPENG